MTTDFTIVNLRRDVKDSAEAFGLPDGFEARFAKRALEASELGVSLQKLAPGESSPFAHRHREQPEELYVVVSGSGTITLDGDDHAISTWDVVRVPGPVERRFAAGDEGLEFIAFGQIRPADDAEMIPVGANAEN
jgi:uncharacterized cupin superfamily protein